MDIPLNKNEIARSLAELAFARPDDAVKLALDPGRKTTKGLDLRLISEIKKGKDGAFELKLIDREALIKLLLEFTGGSDRGDGSAGEFYSALDNAAKAIREGSNEI